MKSLVCWLTIAMTALGSIVSTSVRAQTAIGSPGIVRIPLGGFHSTTIYTPSPDNVTTNVTTQIGVGDYPFPNAMGNYYGYPATSPNTLPQRPIVTNPQPIVIQQQPSTYPRAILTRCVLKTLNDPEQSLVPVDRYTGKPCD
jgi:hypothetical protein